MANMTDFESYNVNSVADLNFQRGFQFIKTIAQLNVETKKSLSNSEATFVAFLSLNINLSALSYAGTF